MLNRTEEVSCLVEKEISYFEKLLDRIRSLNHAKCFAYFDKATRTQVDYFEEATNQLTAIQREYEEHHSVNPEESGARITALQQKLYAALTRFTNAIDRVTTFPDPIELSQRAANACAAVTGYVSYLRSASSLEEPNRETKLEEFIVCRDALSFVKEKLKSPGLPFLTDEHKISYYLCRLNLTYNPNGIYKYINKNIIDQTTAHTSIFYKNANDQSKRHPNLSSKEKNNIFLFIQNKIEFFANAFNGNKDSRWNESNEEALELFFTELSETLPEPAQYELYRYALLKSYQYISPENLSDNYRFFTQQSNGDLQALANFFKRPASYELGNFILKNMENPLIDKWYADKAQVEQQEKAIAVQNALLRIKR